MYPVTCTQQISNSFSLIQRERTLQFRDKYLRTQREQNAPIPVARASWQREVTRYLIACLMCTIYTVYVTGTILITPSDVYTEYRIAFARDELNMQVMECLRRA